MTIKEAYEKRDYEQMYRLIDQLQSKEEWSAVLKDNKGGQLGMILKQKHAFWEVQEKMHKLGLDPLDVAEEILSQCRDRLIVICGEDNVDSRCLRLVLKLLEFHRDREPNEMILDSNLRAILVEDDLNDIIEQAKAIKESYMGGSEDNTEDNTDDDITFD